MRSMADALDVLIAIVTALGTVVAAYITAEWAARQAREENETGGREDAQDT